MIEAPIDPEAADGGPAAVETGDLKWRLPSPEAIAAGALEGALAHTAKKMGVGCQQVSEALRQRHPITGQRYRYALGKRVAEALAGLDKSIRAVYMLDYDATPADVCFREPEMDPRIHLIVWAQRRTQALRALAASIDRALVPGYRAAVLTPSLQSLLDVQVIDDGDVEHRSGYGAMLSSAHQLPLLLWERGTEE